MFGVPDGWVAGAPVLCSLCGRWSIIPADKSIDLMRANAEERREIRDQPKAQRVRHDWRQHHLATKDRGGESA